MLTKIQISNFAIIDELNIQFDKGLSVITGETGAGKSILLGALKLVLGERADLKSLKNNTEKCVIEATFDLKKLNLDAVFEAFDLDYEPETILRREILPSGKSRAFVNDTPATLDALQKLSNFLIDIHSQFNTASLMTEAFQMELLDAVAENKSILEIYQTKYAQYKNIQKKTEKLKSEFTQQSQNLEYQTFLLQELQTLQLQSGEQELLEEEQKKLSNIDAITESLGEIEKAFSTDDFGILSQLKNVVSKLQRFSTYTSQFENLTQRTDSAKIELDDIFRELETKMESIEADPARLQEITDRLGAIYTLQRKHQCQSVEELLVIQQNLEKETFGFAHLEEEIATLEAEMIVLKEELETLSAQISSQRKEIVPKISTDILATLSRLGMENSQIDIQITETTDFTTSGKDKIAFLFSANKGAEPKPIEKAVSGGERSRVMLAIKKLLAFHQNLPTLILDEIDTGVSGKVANEMGNIMREMATKLQVMAITHLPQVASKGQTHFKVYKEDKDNITTTNVVQLETADRLTEIAQLISGSSISEAALLQAKELLER